MLLYIIKSIITLSLLYMPYLLLLRRESFFHFNRLMLLSIMLLSLVLPLFNIHEWAWEQNPMHDHLQGFIEVGRPMVEGYGQQVTTPQHPTVDGSPLDGWVIDRWTLFTLLYVAGMLVTLLIKSFQLILLYRHIHHGVMWTEQQGDITIYCHPGNLAPFSWMSSIVISEEDYESNAHTILCHEMGHIFHHHSFDILLLNLCQVMQWANPLVWIMADSLRDVHEYEADDHVLSSGVNATQYQNLLIKKAIGSSSYAFANGFNHSLLKKRITMMLQKKSNPWMRTKALYLIPVAVVALCAFATPVLTQHANANEAADALNASKVTEKSVNKQISVAENAIVPTESLAESAEKASVREVAEVSEAVKIPAGDVPLTPDDDEVLNKCDVMPTYPGGSAGLMQFLYTNVKYPNIATKYGLQSRFIMQFTVRKDGTCDNFKLVKTIEQDKAGVTVVATSPDGTQPAGTITPEQFEEGKKALEEEVFRVFRLMDKWTPGMDKGKPVNVRFTCPLTFRLQ